MASAETREWYDDTNTSAIVLTGVLGCVIFVVLVIGVHALYHSFNMAEYVRKDVYEPIQSNALLDRQRADLEEYRYLNPERTKIAIPISKAMQLVQEDVTK